MPETDENLRQRLAGLLDQATITFYRNIYDRYDISPPYGKALKAASIGEGFYPVSDESYSGTFGAMHRENRAVLARVGGGLRIGDTTFLQRLPGGRGHRVHYVTTDEKFPDPKLSSLGPMQREKITDRRIMQRELNIGGVNEKAVEKALERLKRKQFVILRECVLRRDNVCGDKRKRRHVQEAFEISMHEAFDASLDIPPVSALRAESYELEEIGEEEVVLSAPGEYVDRKKTLPIERLYKKALDRIDTRLGHRVKLVYYLTPDADPNQEESWQLFYIDTYPEDIELLNDPPTFRKE